MGSFQKLSLGILSIAAIAFILSSLIKSNKKNSEYSAMAQANIDVSQTKSDDSSPEEDSSGSIDEDQKIMTDRQALTNSEKETIDSIIYKYRIIKENVLEAYELTKSDKIPNIVIKSLNMSLKDFGSVVMSYYLLLADDFTKDAEYYGCLPEVLAPKIKTGSALVEFYKNMYATLIILLALANGNKTDIIKNKVIIAMSSQDLTYDNLLSVAPFAELVDHMSVYSSYYFDNLFNNYLLGIV